MRPRGRAPRRLGRAGPAAPAGGRAGARAGPGPRVGRAGPGRPGPAGSVPGPPRGQARRSPPGPERRGAPSRRGPARAGGTELRDPGASSAPRAGTGEGLSTAPSACSKGERRGGSPVPRPPRPPGTDWGQSFDGPGLGSSSLWSRGCRPACT